MTAREPGIEERNGLPEEWAEPGLDESSEPGAPPVVADEADGRPAQAQEGRPTDGGAEGQHDDGVSPDPQGSVEDFLKGVGFGTLGKNPPPDALEAVMRRAVAAMNGVDPLRRTTIREGALQAMKKAKVSAPARVWDAAFVGIRTGTNDEADGADATEPPGIVDTVMRADGSLAWLVADLQGARIVPDYEGAEPWAAHRLPYTPAPGNVVEAALSEGGPSPLEAIREAIMQAVILPEPAGAYATLLAAWVVGTYLLPAFDYWPLLLLEGPPERGKTRLGKVVVYISRRGYVTPTPRGPTLVRDRAYHGVTLMLDVEDLPRVLERGGELGDLLLASFERGARVRLVVHPDAPPAGQVESYAAYGATVVATNRPIRSGSPLASRTLRIALPEAGGVHVPPATRPEDVSKLRGRAAAWAAVTLAEDRLPATIDVPLTGRARDLAGPLLRTLAAAAPDRMGEVTELLRALDVDRRSEGADSWEARVAVAIWQGRDRLDHGRLYVKDVTDVVNNGLPEEEHLTPQQVGVARRQLGLMGGAGGAGGLKYVVWPGDEAARALHDRYAPTATHPGPPEPSASSGSRMGTARTGADDPLAALTTPDEVVSCEGPRHSEMSDDPDGSDGVRLKEPEAVPIPSLWDGLDDLEGER